MSEIKYDIYKQQSFSAGTSVNNLNSLLSKTAQGDEVACTKLCSIYKKESTAYKIKCEILKALSDGYIKNKNLLKDSPNSRNPFARFNHLLPRKLDQRDAWKKVPDDLKTAFLENAAKIGNYGKKSLAALAQMASVQLASDDESLITAAVFYLLNHPDEVISPLEIKTLARSDFVSVKKLIAAISEPIENVRREILISYLSDEDSEIRAEALTNIISQHEDGRAKLYPKGLVINVDEVAESICDAWLEHPHTVTPREIDILVGSDVKNQLPASFIHVLENLYENHQIDIRAKVKIARFFNSQNDGSRQNFPTQKLCEALLKGSWDLDPHSPVGISDPLNLKSYQEKKQLQLKKAKSTLKKPALCKISIIQEKPLVRALFQELGLGKIRDYRVLSGASRHKVIAVDSQFAGPVIVKLSENDFTSSVNNPWDMPVNYENEIWALDAAKRQGVVCPEFIAIGRVGDDDFLRNFSVQTMLEGKSYQDKNYGHFSMAYWLGRNLALLHSNTAEHEEYKYSRKDSFGLQSNNFDSLLSSSRQVLSDSAIRIFDKIASLSNEIKPSSNVFHHVHGDAHAGNITETDSLGLQSVGLIDWELSGHSRYPEFDFCKLPLSTALVAFSSYDEVLKVNDQFRINFVYHMALSTLSFISRSQKGLTHTEIKNLQSLFELLP